MANEFESGIKRRTIPDFLPDNRFTRMPKSRINVEKHTVFERRLDRGSQNYKNPVAIAAGTIIRAAVDIGRYERTLRVNPELTSDQRAHMARLISAASVQATVLTNCLATESTAPMQFISEVSANLAKVNWESAPDVTIPIITSEIPATGTEYPHNITFQNQSSEQRAQIPA